MKQVWAFLNGNKTIICTIALAAVQAFPIPEPYKGLLIYTLTALGGAALVHHVKKGYFTTTKGH